MTDMTTSPRGRAALTGREGVRLKAYRDTKGILTIGIGHTSAAGPPRVAPGLTLTRAEVDEVFARDLAKYERTVCQAVQIPLAQHEFDALVSLCYNIGQGGFARSTVVRRLNAGDRKGAAAAILMWNKPPEIMGRRRGEYRQFLTPYPAEAPPAPAPPPPPAPPPAPEVATAQPARSGGFFLALKALFAAFRKA